MIKNTEKTIAAILFTIAAVVIVYCVQDVFYISNALKSPGTTWKGGVPGSLSASRFPVVGNTMATPLNSLAWSLPGTTITLLISDTPAEQELGLGQISSLASSSGMIFVFNKPDTYAFWMKDMEFPLDIIWLDQNFKIVHIEHSLSPSTYPQAYSPKSPAKYVIEVNAGLADKYSLKEGETMQIYQK
ncbi:MAG: DUF192 domain-containing protein [Candidatus Pacebacteria bacterium]|nr:DUF192 domain-containing protein [Candidatus Paceibacterota bacterium]